MTKINIMSEHLANKIAAGEVVEKISSVVKELLENSLDAGADDIRIVLQSSGLKEITVVDNGFGMDKEDAKLCFERHATSKIKNDNDLFFINSLGFRGEALPSIASVSNITLETNSGNVGIKLALQAGKIVSEEVSGIKKGTKISVYDLFFNTPARLKFLKSETSELASVVNLIEKLALSHPGVIFTLKNNDKTIVKTSGSNNLLKTIHEIYGANVSSRMLELNVENEDFFISGYISKPEVMKNNRNHFITFVNNRLVKSFEINKAINEAYHTYKPVDKFPIIILNIEIDPCLIDVNIHPSKQEIKISKSKELCELIYNEAKNTLAKTFLIPEIKEEILEQNLMSNENKLPEKEIVQYSFDFSKSEDIVSVEEVSDIRNFKLYPVGLVHGAYIVAQNDEGLFLIDQHAAAERINYEKYLDGLRRKEVLKKSLLIPINLEFSASDYLKLLEKKDLIESFGIIFEQFGESSIIVKAHPDYLKVGYEEESIEKILNIIINSKYDRVKFEEHIAITLACKMSIKANHKISFSEMEYFLDEITKCDNPYTCPHGRPTIIKYSVYELEKLFKRSV